MGEDFSMPESLLVVVMRGWCHLKGLPMPEADEVVGRLDSLGLVRSDGRVRGIRLQGVTEDEVRDILGPVFDEIAMASLDPDAKEDERATPRSGICFEGDSVLAFVGTCCEKKSDLVVDVRALYDDYECVCSLNGRKPVKLERFQRTLQSPKLGLKVEDGKLVGAAPNRELIDRMIRESPDEADDEDESDEGAWSPEDPRG